MYAVGEQSEPSAPSRLVRFLGVFQAAVFATMVYGTAAFLLGWVAGGPDIMDGASVLASECAPPLSLPVFVRGVVHYLSFGLVLFLLYQFSPRANAWLTKFTRRRGGLRGIIILIFIAVIAGLGFLVLFVLSGCSLFAKSLLIIAPAGVLGGGFQQVMAAAVLPNPDSKREQRVLRDLQEKSRQKAADMGLDPEEAAAQTEKCWNSTGDSMNVLGKAFGYLLSVIQGIVSGGIHGGALSALGASFFIGLGVGISGSAMCIFLYYSDSFWSCRHGYYILLYRVDESRTE